MVKKAQKTYAPQELEARIQGFWKETGAYEATKEHCKDGERFYFVDGPPYTTGHIHLGTAWNKTLKDVKIRYLRMQGYNVRDQAGFDMHGLPIEVKVEKELGITNKKQIEENGIDIFVEKCLEFSTSFQKTMAEEFKSLGIWLDWENPYLTIKNTYIEGAWWTLKQAFGKGHLEESKRVLNWCPRCQTALAEAEVEYWDETDPSIYVKFPLKDRPGEYILIWTTTPWTLPANQVVAVHPDFTYAKVRFTRDGKEDIIYLAEDCAGSIGKAGRYQKMEILERFQGSELQGIAYEHVLREKVPFQQQEGVYQNLHRVVVANFVTTDMTGVVHVAPGHGPDDFELGQECDLSPFCPVDEEGKFTEEVPEFQGRFIKHVDPDVIAYLDGKGLLLNSGKITHRFGHCWRCKHAITHRTTTQWFLRVSRLSQEMLAEIERINWTPEWAGSSRFYDWVKNTRDWCISRQRYWGIPLPIWRCQNPDCGKLKVVSSREDLVGVQGYQEGMNLHRPWIDKVVFRCACGETMTRVSDVLDVWFDSAVCSWAQLGFPGNTEEFEKWWPCRWITEAHDQTRGWFYSQLGASMVAFGKSPYESVLMHGFALDSTGRAMSKSLGNNVEPITVTSKHGVDSLRFYLLITNPAWDDLPFLMSEVENAKRTLNILWNTYVFSTTYMALDDFNPQGLDYQTLKYSLKVEDHWCLSKLENLKKKVTPYVETGYHHKALREMKDFILNVLSRWYVKLIRDRSWVEGEDNSKTAAYFTLHECLSTLARLLAPFTPHIAEEMYQNLEGDRATISMESWPKVHQERIDLILEAKMDRIQEIVDTVLSMRQKAEVGLRWPLMELVLQKETAGKEESSQELASALDTLSDILLEQINIKRITILPPGEDWNKLVLSASPNFGRIGPVFKEQGKEVAQIIMKTEPKTLAAKLQNSELTHEGKVITQEMVNFQKILPQGYHEMKTSSGLKIYLDTRMTKETLREGYSREVIRRIQEMRKELNLPLEKQVASYLQGDSELLELITPRLEYIARETRSRIFLQKPDSGFIKEWKIKEKILEIGLLE